MKKLCFLEGETIYLQSCCDSVTNHDLLALRQEFYFSQLLISCGITK